MTSSATPENEKREREREKQSNKEGREEMRAGQEDGSRVANRSVPQGL